MLWKVALYLVLAWAAVCTMLTMTFFGRLAFIAIRDRLRGRRDAPLTSGFG